MQWNHYHYICDTIVQFIKTMLVWKDNMYSEHKLAEHTQSEIVFRIET